MHVTPMTGGVGAEIVGADVRNASQFDDIFAAFVEHAVIAIRGQDILPEEQIAFAERFGTININRFFAKVPGYEKLAMVLKEPDQEHAIGESWHTDHSYDEAPAMCSILHCIETPSTGGDTLFASMYRVFDGLSDGLKDTLRGLNAWHSSRHAFGYSNSQNEAKQTGRVGNPELATQDSLHPVVIRHPLSGRETLYVNPGFTIRIDGWTEEESKSLLDYLYSQSTLPEYTCRVRWQPGTITVWDNRATWHRAVNDYHGHRRLMHRITVEGEPLSAAQAS